MPSINFISGSEMKLIDSESHHDGASTLGFVHGTNVLGLAALATLPSRGFTPSFPQMMDECLDKRLRPPSRLQSLRLIRATSMTVDSDPAPDGHVAAAVYPPAHHPRAHVHVQIRRHSLYTPPHLTSPLHASYYPYHTQRPPSYTDPLRSKTDAYPVNTRALRRKAAIMRGEDTIPCGPLELGAACFLPRVWVRRVPHRWRDYHDCTEQGETP
ncbi:hypothetical protein FB451DRAFT_1557279 [Mycena latifolia]|nr:hypothetical protein FB451DRAFT_1557279 [Mycena latifolia]